MVNALTLTPVNQLTLRLLRLTPLRLTQALRLTFLRLTVPVIPLRLTKRRRELTTLPRGLGAPGYAFPSTASRMRFAFSAATKAH